MDGGSKTTHEETFQEKLMEETLFLRLLIDFNSNVSPGKGAERAIFHEKLAWRAATDCGPEVVHVGAP
jgi:hypothetical protein